MLRSSGPTAAQSHADLRSAKVNRRDSFGSMSLRNNDFDSTKRYSISGSSGGGGGNNGLRRESFGGSMYLRKDSSGNTNLIKRDSFGSQGLKGNGLNSLSQKDLTILRNYSTMPRDYVKVVVDNNNKSNLKKEINSILRKDSFKSVNNNKHVYIEDKVENILNNKENYKENEKKKNVVLTKENLTKHVTLLENENNYNNNKTDYVKKELNTEIDGKEILGRRDSSDSYGSVGYGGTNRRISIDSLDVRRNSWGRRSSQGSSILGNGIKEFNEVIKFTNKIKIKTISWFESLIKFNSIYLNIA